MKKQKNKKKINWMEDRKKIKIERGNKKKEKEKK